LSDAWKSDEERKGDERRKSGEDSMGITDEREAWK
jgi:hypothetical protein